MNTEWIIGSIVVPIVVAAITVIKRKRKQDNNAMLIHNTSSNITTVIPVIPNAEETRKAKTHILFIDDDAKFKVVTILKKSGWHHTKHVKDIDNLDDELVKAVHIFFVDIQGVGISLQFNDEGLGLALALKKKYPEKKVVIYSSETKGDRFHEALRKADSFLPKNAEPYEFQQLVEQYSKEIFQ